MRIKGFDKDLKCRGFQFEVGKTYDTGAKDEDLELCSDTVFHYCDSLRNVHKFYDVRQDNRFCEIEVLGREITDGTKYGSNKIRIVREIVGEELRNLKGLNNHNTGVFSTGNYNAGNYNTGDYNTGYYNTGYYNTGYYNTGDVNAGNYNTGDYNAGNYNTGDYNTGNYNTGYYNTGNYNTGNYNTGNYNTGDYNTGDYNTCDFSNGFFCTQAPKISIFNLPTDMTASQFYSSKYYRAIRSSVFPLIEYKCDKLIKHTYKEACAIWWENMTDKNKEIIKSIPNFSKEIFKEITGIEV